jgi:hypothetical protein
MLVSLASVENLVARRLDRNLGDWMGGGRGVDGHRRLGQTLSE